MFNIDTMLTIYLWFAGIAVTIGIIVGLYMAIRSAIDPSYYMGVSALYMLPYRNRGAVRDIRRQAELQAMERTDRMTHADKETK